MTTQQSINGVYNYIGCIPEGIPKYEPRQLTKNKTDIDVLTDAYKNKLNTLLIGQTGTGKTHAIMKIAEMNKVRCKRINLSAGADVSDLIGQFVPSEGGGFKWVDGVLIDFARKGGIVVLDEINACPPEILFVLHSLLDFREVVLTSKDGEYIKVHPECWFVATCNPSDYAGLQEVNAATHDRWQATIYYDYDIDIEIKLGINKNMIDFAEKLRKQFRLGELSVPISTRTLLQYTQNEKIFGTEIADMMFLSKFEDSNDRSSVKETLDLHRSKIGDIKDQQLDE